MRIYKTGEESPLFKDLTNLKFGRLTAKKYFVRKYKNHREHCWICECECGNLNTIRTNNLISGKRFECDKCTIKRTSKARIRPENATIIGRILRNYKLGAHNRGYEFSLTNENFNSLIFSNCYYCNSEPKVNIGDEKNNKSGIEFKRNGIDRLVNSIGYIESNVVSCCETCNRAKMTLDHDIFLNLINKIYSNILEKRSTTIPQGSTE